jgi:hypothetical protein
MERHGNPTTGGRKNISDTILPERRAKRADEVHSVGALEALETHLERPSLRRLAAGAGEGVRVGKVCKVAEDVKTDVEKAGRVRAFCHAGNRVTQDCEGLARAVEFPSRIRFFLDTTPPAR